VSLTRPCLVLITKSCPPSICERNPTWCTAMSLSTQSATQGKSIATTALRSVGLIDRDATMRDATDNAGGRKGRIRSTRGSRILDTSMDKPLGSRTVNIIAQFHSPDRKAMLALDLLGSCCYPLLFSHSIRRDRSLPISNIVRSIKCEYPAHIPVLQILSLFVALRDQWLLGG
jgi:hypothetical protein